LRKGREGRGIPRKGKERAIWSEEQTGKGKINEG